MATSLNVSISIDYHGRLSGRWSIKLFSHNIWKDKSIPANKLTPSPICVFPACRNHQLTMVKCSSVSQPVHWWNSNHTILSSTWKVHKPVPLLNSTGHTWHPTEPGYTHTHNTHKHTITQLCFSLCFSWLCTRFLHSWCNKRSWQFLSSAVLASLACKRVNFFYQTSNF